eukprot:TRINITY_DN16867_c0_g2_i1.p1 TRINITY_DN16867_c0_g2~~TRINITY_DN16867_c0_g2_i1.p1  ORF type:complete len:271 (+),score=88.26 TRINITY_DN16867_c0_g2_i1:75-887(+)
MSHWSPPGAEGGHFNELGPEVIQVRVRGERPTVVGAKEPADGAAGNIALKVATVDRVPFRDDGPCGAKGAVWFFARLMVFVLCVSILSTKSWAYGEGYVFDVQYNVSTVGDVTERLYLDRTEVGLITSCIKARAESATLGPLDGEICDYSYTGTQSMWGKEWDTAALVFGILFLITLAYSLAVDGANLFYPGWLPVDYYHPALERFLRHWTWLCMLLTWACFLGGWDNGQFDLLGIEYAMVTYLDWGFITWVILWCLWFLKAVLIEMGKI